MGLAAVATSVALVVACPASGTGSPPTKGSSSTPLESRSMSQVRISSSASSVVGNDGSGTAVVTVNGRVCRLDVPDTVAVRTVVDNSYAYLEITDKSGKTRRIDCRS